MTNVLVFGDSIAQGYYDTEGGWVDRLKRYYLEEELKHGWNQSINVFNLSLSGNTTGEILSRIAKETPPRVWDGHDTIFVFAVGINDSTVLKNNENKVSKNSFRANLEKLYKYAKKYSDKIIFIGLTPVEESKVTPMPWNLQESYYNNSIKEYNDIIKNFCREKKIDFIDLWKNFSRLKYHSLLEDGVHPNTQCHEKIFEAVLNFLRSEVISK